jgi:hypothetical protein
MLDITFLDKVLQINKLQLFDLSNDNLAIDEGNLPNTNQLKICGQDRILPPLDIKLKNH